MIQLGRLEGFYRVARAEGYARAAREFPYPITQPGVYQQVRKLEGALGEARADGVEAVRNGGADLLVDHLPAVPPDLEGIRVATVRAFIAVRAGHPAARHKPLRLRHLAGEPFVAYGAGRPQQRELQL